MFLFYFRKRGYLKRSSSLKKGGSNPGGKYAKEIHIKYDKVYICNMKKLHLKFILVKRNLEFQGLYRLIFHSLYHYNKKLMKQ